MNEEKKEIIKELLQNLSLSFNKIEDECSKQDCYISLENIKIMNSMVQQTVEYIQVEL